MIGKPWVSFAPCGFVAGDAPEFTAFQAAPNIERWIVDADAVAALLVPRLAPGDKRCIALLMKNGRQIVVKGTARAVLAKLTADQPDCIQLGTKDRRDRDPERPDQGR